VMSRDYGHRLQDYAYKLIKDDVGLEFDAHLEEWKIHCNKLVLWTRMAFNNHHGHLQNIKKMIEAEMLRRQQMAMLALSLIAGPGISFVAGSLQYRLGPILFGKRTASLPRTAPLSLPKPPSVNVPRLPAQTPHPSTVPINRPPGKVPFDTRRIVKGPPAQPQKGPSPPPPRLQPEPLKIKVPDKIVARKPEGYDSDFSKTKGKVLGDMGGSVIKDFGLKQTIKAVSPDTAQLEGAIQSAKQSIDIDGLANNLDEVWRQAKIAGKQALQNYANTFREDITWGDRLWAELNIGKYGPVKGKGEAAELDLLDRGMDRIYALVNKQREEWAKRDDWFYYGHKPPVLYQSPMISAIETEIWAYWIHSEEFRPVMNNDSFCSMNEDQERGSGFPRCEMAYAVGKSGISLDIIYSKLMDLGVAPHSWDMLEAARRAKAQSMRDDSLVPVELRGIEGKIDTDKEFQIVQTWAETRKPVMFGRQLVSQPRHMGNLRLIGPH
ncbi:MAG: hypothetical protein SGJ20_19300, partial [Planctomycetota bacterium]|nr:hypothetical protein [Planctomycetota bacterium]